MARARYWRLSFTVYFFVLLALFFVTTPVFADSEAPPVGAETEPTAIPTVTTEPEDAISQETITTEPPTESILLEETTLPSEENLATEEPASEVTEEAMGVEPTVEITEAFVVADELTAEQQLVEALSVNDLLLTDEDGNPIAMASEEGSIAAETSDPYFMAGGVYYGFSSTGICSGLVLPANCTTTANPISAAINAYQTTYAGTATGAIYLEAGTYNETSSLIVSTASTLTGIIGAGSDVTTINMASGTNLSVQNTTSGFTLQGLTINGNINSNGGSALVDFNDNSGNLVMDDVVVKNTNTDGDGIEIASHTGNVTLNEVQSSENEDEGARINNTGNTTITNSEFDLNAGHNSLQVTATGTVKLDGVSASENAGGNGATIQAGKGITITNSTFESNTDYTSPNSWGYGLVIASGTTGTITMNNVYASSNEESNVYISHVNSVIKLSNLEVNNSNHGYGIYINNCDASGGICTATVTGSVTLTSIEANSNDYSNIYVLASGAITLYDVTARYSDTGYGTYLENQEAKSTQTVKVSNGYFDSAEMAGLAIRSKGSITLNHIESNYSNSGDGLNIDNTYGTGSVTILSTLGMNHFNQNFDEGVDILSKGTVTINDSVVNYNDGNGVSVQNQAGSGNVVIKNHSYYQNGTTSGNDLFITSHGTVTLSSITIYDSQEAAVYIANDGASSAKGVNLTDVSISYGESDALIVISRGTIKLTRVDAESNNDSTYVYGGIYLNNQAGTSGVIITDSESNSNYQGWTIFTNGSVSITKIQAYYNEVGGIDIDNHSSPSSPAVTIKGAQIYSNDVRGLSVLSKGTISLTSVLVSSNNLTSSVSGYSAILNNTFGTGGIVISGTSSAGNEFSYNNISDGLTINTNGSVKISYISATNNDGNGVTIHANGSGTVTITTIDASYNDESGLDVSAKGTITVSNPIIRSNRSGYAGMVLENTAGTGNVVVQRTSSVCSGSYDLCYFGDNRNAANTSGFGLVINTNGSVILKYFEVYSSPSGGITVNNTGGTGSVTITSVNASSNGGTGIYVITNGAVTVNTIYTSYNIGSGLYIDGQTGIGKTISITKPSALHNGYDGIYVLSGGNVKLAGVYSYANSGSSNGLFVDNSYGTGSITLSNSGSTINDIRNNPGYGVTLTTNGSVVINKTGAVFNGLTQIYVNNPLATGSVTLNTVEVGYSSSGYGIFIRTMGNVSLTGVSSYNDSLTNVDIDNSTGTGSVTVKNGEFYSSSTGSGLRVISNGTITLTIISSKYNYNGYAGYLNNSSSAGTPGIVVQNSGSSMNTFSNGEHGLAISSNGYVKVTNTESTAVTDRSIFINNSTGSGTVTLTNVTGTSYDDFGIYVSTKNTVVGKNIAGDGDSIHAAIYIDNCALSGTCTGVGNVTLTGVTGNSSAAGLEVHSNGNIVVTNLSTQDNYNSAGGGKGYGAFLDNSNSSINGYITVNKAYAYDNEDGGIRILSKGNVTLNGVTSLDNYASGASGVYINNTFGTGNVSILSSMGANNFNNNNYYGLELYTNGTITGSKITANDNDLTGLYLSSSGADKTISLTTINVKHNYQNGILIESQGAVTLTGVTAVDNGWIYSNGDGIRVNTNGHALTVSKSLLIGNGSNGLDATVGATQTVKVNSTLYFGNGRYGGGDAPNIITDGILLFS